MRESVWLRLGSLGLFDENWLNSPNTKKPMLERWKWPSGLDQAELIFVTSRWFLHSLNISRSFSRKRFSEPQTSLSGAFSCLSWTSYGPPALRNVKYGPTGISMQSGFRCVFSSSTLEKKVKFRKYCGSGDYSAMQVVWHRAAHRHLSLFRVGMVHILPARWISTLSAADSDKAVTSASLNHFKVTQSSWFWSFWTATVNNCNYFRGLFYILKNLSPRGKGLKVRAGSWAFIPRKGSI